MQPNISQTDSTVDTPLVTHFSLVAQTEVDPQGEIHIPFEPSQ